MEMLKDDLVKSALISNIFYAMGYPLVQKILITNVTYKYIALNAIILCISTIILGKLWDECSKNLYKVYGLMQVLKSAFYIALLMLIINNSLSYRFYYVADTFVMAFISKNIIFGSNKLKSLRYNQDDRNKFDNKSLIASNLASLLGLTISLLIHVSTNVAFVFLTLGMIIDAAFNYKVFKITGR